MAGTVREAKLDSAARRARLPRGRQAHWHALIRGRAHLGYQCWPAKKGKRPQGRWLMRRYAASKYVVIELGRADDEGHEADGERTLSFDQAQAAALAALNAPRSRQHRLTVRQAMANYITAKRAQGQATVDVDYRGTAHILPPLGDEVVAELTADRIRRWLADLAAAPAMVRTARGKKQNFRPPPADDEAIRRRRANANRVLSMLKAMLNHAYDEGHVPSNEAWGRRVKPFMNVERARIRYLTVAEAQRLVNACDPDFRLLVQGALQTGARYAELCRLQVADFNPDAGTVTIRKSKTAEARHIILTHEGSAFFKQVCAGRLGDELVFRNRGRVARALERERERLKKAGKPPEQAVVADKGEWRPAEQSRAMRDACTRARLKPPIGFHGLRHTWASLATMGGVPLMVVGRNLGHVDTRMVERHYGHLAPSFVVDAIRAGAPKFGLKLDEKVVALG